MWFVVGILGLLLGSFTNVLIARVPHGHGVVAGRSACPQCGQAIAWYDNIPVVSWLALRGRCRDCRQPISWLYPVVEIVVAALCVLGYGRWGISITTAMICVMAVATTALFVIDIRHRRLPHRIVLPTLAIAAVLAVAAWLAGERATWWSAIIGLMAVGGFYGALWLVYPRGMGFGDVTTGALVGWVAGFLGYQELAVAAIAGPLVGGVMVVGLAVFGRLRRGQAVPYGPALLAGAWIGFLAGPQLAEVYLGLLGMP